MPAMGLSLFLIAVGAILAFAVSAAVEGIAIPTVGVILMIVGGIGLLFSLLFLMSWSPWASEDRRTIRTEHIDHHVDHV